MPGITLTGADERTSLKSLLALADLGAEIGLLYSFSPDGRNRYPLLPWLVDAVQALGSRASLHFCGRRAREQLLNGNLWWLTDRAGRVQVNGALTPQELRIVCEMCKLVQVITQHTEENQVFAQYEIPTANHSLLVDASGGRGLSPAAWVRPDTPKPVGFAGGLGPDNLAIELPKIAAVAGTGEWWIDMESRLRDSSDWFDAGKALRVLEVWQAWKEEGKTGR